VPGLTGSHSSAFEATTLNLGSSTSSFVSLLAANLASFLASAMTIQNLQRILHLQSLFLA